MTRERRRVDRLIGPLRVLLWAATVVLHFLAFLLACDIGLRLSAPSETGVPVSRWWLSILALTVGLLLAADRLMFMWTLRTRYSRSWIVAALVGGISAFFAASFAAVGAILLASGTWGRAAGGDFAELNRLVESTVPAWGIPLFLLFVGVALSGVSLASRSSMRSLLSWVGAGTAAAAVLAACIWTAFLGV